MKTYNIVIQDDNGRQKWLRFESTGLSGAFLKVTDLVRITHKAWRLVSEIIPEQ